MWCQGRQGGLRKQRGRTVEPVQGIVEDIFALERRWMRRHQNHPSVIHQLWCLLEVRRLPRSTIPTMLLTSNNLQITIGLGKRSNKPGIRSIGITVSDTLEYLAAVMSVGEILSDFPELTAEDTHARLLLLPLSGSAGP